MDSTDVDTYVKVLTAYARQQHANGKLFLPELPSDDELLNNERLDNKGPNEVLPKHKRLQL